MYQIVITVIAIALAAMIGLMGMQSMPTATAVASRTSLQVSTGYRIIELAYGSYRMSNGGGTATTANWQVVLAPYMQGTLQTPANMSWSLVAYSGSMYACISSAEGTIISVPVIDGLSRAIVNSNPSSILGKNCTLSPNALYDGTVSVVFPLLSGS